MKYNKETRELIDIAENVIKEGRKVLDYLQIEVNKIKKESQVVDTPKKKKKKDSPKEYDYRPFDGPPPVNSGWEYYPK